MNGSFRRAQGRALLVLQTETVIKCSPKRCLCMNDLVHCRVSFSDVDLPCFCMGSLAGVPLGGRRLKPCTRALPGAVLSQWQVSPAVRAWHTYTLHTQDHNYIALCNNIDMYLLGDTTSCAKQQDLYSLAACVSHVCFYACAC